MSEDNVIVTIPKMRRFYKDTKANLDALTSVKDESLAYGTDTQVLYRQNGDGAANWEATTSAPTDIGEGHVLLFPLNYDSIGQGTWAISINIAHYFASRMTNTSDANYDELIFKAYLAKGTYTLLFIAENRPSCGIVDIDIDGVEVASIDTYNVAPTPNVIDRTTGIVIATSSLKTITMIVDGKNGASSGHTIFPQLIALWRTV